MARLQSNDSAALEILFGRYARLVLGIARGIVRDSGEAEDVVQEAFFYLYKNRCFLTRRRGVRNIGLFKSHFTGHWTGSRTWHEEAFTLVQTSPLSAIL